MRKFRFNESGKIGKFKYSTDSAYATYELSEHQKVLIEQGASRILSRRIRNTPSARPASSKFISQANQETETRRTFRRFND